MQAPGQPDGQGSLPWFGRYSGPGNKAAQDPTGRHVGSPPGSFPTPGWALTALDHSDLITVRVHPNGSWPAPPRGGMTDARAIGAPAIALLEALGSRNEGRVSPPSHCCEVEEQTAHHRDEDLDEILQNLGDSDAE